MGRNAHLHSWCFSLTLPRTIFEQVQVQYLKHSCNQNNSFLHFRCTLKLVQIIAKNRETGAYVRKISCSFANHSVQGEVLASNISKMNQAPIFVMGRVKGITSTAQFCLIPSLPLYIDFSKKKKKTKSNLLLEIGKKDLIQLWKN